MADRFKIIKPLFLIGGLLFSMLSCTRPNIDLINKDLRITLPNSYKLLTSDSDPLGLDVNQTFLFQFDSLDSRQLEREIVNTPLYNVAGPKEFDSLAVQEKLKILRILADNKLSSYWVKDGSTYWFNGDSIFLNTHDNIISRLFSHKIILPNREPENNRSRTDGIPMWTVRAVFDTKKKTLFYNYIHP